MSQLNQYKNSVSSDKIYYDIQIANVESTSVVPPNVFFNESRNTPFLMCPEDYYMSIIRFTLDTSTLPIFIPTIQTNPAINLSQNPDQTIYTFQFSYNGVYSNEIPIIWSPQDTSLTAQPFITVEGITTQSNTNGYYYCYTFEYFVSIINREINSAFGTFVTNYNVAYPLNPIPLTAVAPVFAFDGSTSVFRIMFEQSFLNTNATPIYFYMNAPMFDLFGSLNALKLGYNVNGRNYQIIVENYAGFNSYSYLDTITGVTYNVIEVIQEWSTVSAWSPISALVFTTSTVPIAANLLSKPTVYIQGNVLGAYGNNSNFQQVLTDFVSDTGFYKPNIVYNPSAEYRLLSMTGNTPLSNFDVSIFWRNNFGELIPFLLGSGCSATLKILFTKKDSVNGK
jgi:hypothetical protein